jgi:hypothetical protein
MTRQRLSQPARMLMKQAGDYKVWLTVGDHALAASRAPGLSERPKSGARITSAKTYLQQETLGAGSEVATVRPVTWVMSPTSCPALPATLLSLIAAGDIIPQTRGVNTDEVRVFAIGRGSAGFLTRSGRPWVRCGWCGRSRKPAMTLSHRDGCAEIG